jgi:hypothetical protein
MRRIISFIASVGLICVGAYFVYHEVFVRYSGPGSKLFGAGLVFFGGGTVWLWFEFLGPIVIRRIIEKRAESTRSKDRLPM